MIPLTALPALPAKDLEHVIAFTGAVWEEVRDRRLFITGGTGFFGCWLVETFLHANRMLGLNAHIAVLTRDANAFRTKMPHLTADPALQIIEGNVRGFTFPTGAYSYVIHAATETDSFESPEPARALFEANVAGTARILDFCDHCHAERLLFTSSGAVYGPQPPEISHLPESFIGAPSTIDTTSAYAQSKRASEFLFSVYGRERGVRVALARCFAFVGPHLPLNANYAIGNFIRDAIRGGPIRVGGDGTPYRAYLYAADLAIWLWKILLKGGTAAAYNVGSDEGLTIAELAQRVAQTIAPGARVEIARQTIAGQRIARYVPSIELARSELGLAPRVGLREAIRRTAQWYASAHPSSRMLPVTPL